MKKIMLFLVVLCVALGLVGCGNQPIDEADLQQKIDEVQEQIDNTNSKNSNERIGTYVTPDESSFSYEKVENGVAVTGYSGTEKAIVIPESLGGASVVEIKSGAFSNTGILGVKMPNSMISVADKAFYYCTTIKEVYFGEKVTTIGAQAFEGCVALATVEFDPSINSIGTSAFANCQSLEQVTFPDGLQTIDIGAFCMSGLKQISIPGSLKAIGNQAFTCCESLEKVEINSGVETIGEEAFEGCPKLKEVIIPDSVTTIEFRAFNQCANVTITAPTGSQGESYANENGITFNAMRG